MISFIIPAYNAERYLERAVNSIIKNIQQADEIEILIIENGSKDQTSHLAMQLAEQFSMIRVFHSPKGVSNARNLGIENAKGEWIVFVDADDYLMDSGMRALLHDAATGQSDMYAYGHQAGDCIRNIVSDDTDIQFLQEKVEACRICMIENPTRYMQVWAKLFRTSIIKEHNIRFDTNLRLSEDSDFTLQYTKYCEGIVWSAQVVYYYSTEADSTMRTFDPEIAGEYVRAMERTKEKIANETKSIQDAFVKYILMHLNIAMVRGNFVKDNNQKYSQKHKRMREIASEEVFLTALRQIRFRECLRPRLIPALLMKLHLYRLAAGIFILRANSNAKKEHKK